jgi:hypothetical protein
MQELAGLAGSFRNAARGPQSAFRIEPLASLCSASIAGPSVATAAVARSEKAQPNGAAAFIAAASIASSVPSMRVAIRDFAIGFDAFPPREAANCNRPPCAASLKERERLFGRVIPPHALKAAA